MLQAARLAPKMLGESAELVAAFAESQFTESGGFADRQGRPDLYYTVFGLEAMLALRKEPPRERVAIFLRTIQKVEALDFVHACSLARCGADIAKTFYSNEMT